MKGAVLQLVVLVLTVGIDAAWTPIDWTRVKPVEELDHYWARLPPELQIYRTNASRPARITNGREADPGQFPYQVLVLSEFGALTTMCGGSVLSRNFLLTAAHCVMLDQFTTAAGGTAIMGAHNRMVVEPTQQRIRFARSGISVHPQYTPTNFRFDVVVIGLGAPMSLTEWVQPVRLPAPTDSRHFDGLIGTVTGFGRISDQTTTFAAILRYTSNPVMSNGDCLAFWGTPLVEPQNVCLSGAAGRSACSGDSGGPLTVNEGNESLQIGVTSFGSANGCTRGMPSVFARTTFFLDWIIASSDYVPS